jgi:defect in organelle trafficking protein DotC
MRSSRSLRRTALTGTALLLLTGLGACSSGNVPAVQPTASADIGVNINNNQSFFPDQSDDEQMDAPPALSKLEQLSKPPKQTPKQQAQTLLFLPAMRDAAFEYGVDGGLAYSTNVINSVLRAHAAALSKTYDFTRIVTYEPGGAMILPPVISSSVNTYQEDDFGRTIRAANRTYDIIQEAQFAPNAPLWFSYLYRPWHSPKAPATSALPQNDTERAEWVRFVDEGWQDGIEQGVMNFKLDAARLNQNFIGMVRYRQLYDAGKVSAPIVQDQYLGVTGTGQTMREGDRVERILQEPTLDVPHIANPDILPSPGTSD